MSDSTRRETLLKFRKSDLVDLVITLEASLDEIALRVSRCPRVVWDAVSAGDPRQSPPACSCGHHGEAVR